MTDAQATATDVGELASGIQLEEIGCQGCGRSFLTQDGPGMLEAIKGSCPDCGDTFELTS